MEDGTSGKNVGLPIALIIEPTRDLCDQVRELAAKTISYLFRKKQL